MSTVICLQEGRFVTSDTASRLYLMFQKQMTPLRINGEEFCKASAEEELLLLQTSHWVALKAGGFAMVSSCLMQVLSYSCLKEELQNSPLAWRGSWAASLACVVVCPWHTRRTRAIRASP